MNHPQPSRHRRFALAVSAFALICLVPALSSSNLPEPKHYTFRVVQSFPHDPASFTQGLLFKDGHLYESTGLNGHSSVRVDDLTTGKATQEVDLSERFFGEGLTDWKDTLVQLTWQNHVAFVYDRQTLRRLRSLPWPREGWGITHDNEDLIVSDGSATLYFVNPETFAIRRTVTVRDRNQDIDNLNELEFIHGEIFANIWHQNRIARISPQTGAVLGWVDLTNLLSPMYRVGPEDVLNGIAYDERSGRIFVTGKHWPLLFEIRLVP